MTSRLQYEIQYKHDNAENQADSTNLAKFFQIASAVFVFLHLVIVKCFRQIIAQRMNEVAEKALCTVRQHIKCAELAGKADKPDASDQNCRRKESVAEHAHDFTDSFCRKNLSYIKIYAENNDSGNYRCQISFVFLHIT